MPAAKKSAAKKATPAKKAPAKKPKADPVGNAAEVAAKLEKEGTANVPSGEPHKVVPPSTAPAHVEPEVDPALAEQIMGDAGEPADALEAGFLGSPIVEP